MKDAHGSLVPHTAHRVGIVYQERYPDASALGRTLHNRLLAEGYECWSVPSASEYKIDERLAATDVVLVLGGDGTILSAARACAPFNVPLLGINFGRVGFLTELEPQDVGAQLEHYLRGEYWVDERSMLSAEVELNSTRHHMLALNDVVLARRAQPRVIRVDIRIDHHAYGTVVADGVIVCTATGSTAYNLAAGGPILHPQVRSPVVTPISPHLASSRSVVLEPQATIVLEVVAGSGGAVLSADGQINHDVPDGTQVKIMANQSVTRFLRRRPPTDFYHVLTSKLREPI
jgi:NAD+ kinase